MYSAYMQIFLAHTETQTHTHTRPVSLGCTADIVLDFLHLTAQLSQSTPTQA